MSHLPFRRVVLGICVLALVALVFLAAVHYYKLKFLNDSQKSEGSAFVVDPDAQPEGLGAAPEYKIAWGTEAFDHNAEWEYKSTPFIAEVTKASEENSLITIKFTGPTSHPSIDTEKEVNFSACNEQITFLINENTQATSYPGINFITTAQVGDEIISYCTDEGCTTAGRVCKIIKRNNE